MPAPASVDELLNLVVKSGVTDDSRLKAYTQKLADEGSVPSEPSTMAGNLVRDGFLTYFQAEQLLQGKWKRFTIGKYKVLERLGAGGMGQVFLCEHKFMRRRVAVKVLPTAKAEDPASLERFYREARAVAAVDHPNLVRAYDIDQDDNLHFLVMEYVDGTNLQDLVKKAGPLAVTRACHYIYGSAIGLQHAHEVGLVHRDIKPGNILVDRSGVVKILDMGLARFFHDEDDALTKKYDENVLGTADYLAPEQALESHTVDIRADIYSLGATFYYLLTGSAPFPEGSVAQKLIWHQTRVPKPIREYRPDVPEDVIAVVDRMMAKDMTQRYQLPADIMAALTPRVATAIAPPSERELPHLSPAAAGAGGQSLRPSASTTTQVLSRPGSTFPSFAHGTGSPSSASSWPGPQIPGSGPSIAGAATVVEPVEAPSPGGIWEGLSSDTQNLESSDTEQPALMSSISSRSHSGSSGVAGTVVAKRTVPLWAWAGVSLLLAIGAVAGAYNFLIKTPTPKPDQDPKHSPGAVRTPRTIFVSKDGGENTYTSLQQALIYVRAGDRIEIKDEKIAEKPNTLPLRLGGPHLKDVVITSNLPANAPVSIEFGGDASAVNVPMIEIVNADGLVLKNIAINGKNLYGTGIQITGNCPGVKLDDVAIRGTTVGIRLEDAMGTAEHPIVLDHVYIQCLPKLEAGMILVSRPDRTIRNILIQQCRFEGVSIAAGRKDKDGKEIYNLPKATAVQINANCENVSFVLNRLFNLNRGISIGELADQGSMQLLIENNTFHTVRGALVFETQALNAKGTYHVTLRRNLFIKTDAIAKHSGNMGTIDGFDAGQNAREDAQKSRDGNLKVAPINLEGFLMNPPSTNATTAVKDADFLRYSKDSKPGKGLDFGNDKGVMVGYWVP